jgi:hypothetical protein
MGVDEFSSARTLVATAAIPATLTTATKIVASGGSDG